MKRLYLFFLLLIISGCGQPGKTGNKSFSSSIKPQAKVLGADVYAWFPDGRVKKVSAGDGIYVHPCVHPEGGDVIFYGAVFDMPPRILKANLVNGEITALTPAGLASDNAVYSWDGKKIVFCSDRASGRKPASIEDVAKFPPPEDGIINIFIMDANGQNVRQLTSGPYQDQRPCFSPDGKTIAFVSNRGSSKGEFRLWSLAVEGNITRMADAKKPKLMNRDVLAYRPWWSKDGKSIYFFTDVDGRQRICQIPAEGGEFTTFANDDKGNSRGPFADPGSDVLLMHSTRDGIWKIWELPLDGVSEPRLLQPPGFPKATHPTRAKSGVITFDVWKVAN